MASRTDGNTLSAPNVTIQSFTSPYDANGNYTSCAAATAATAVTMAPSSGSTAVQDDNLMVKLDDRELWQRFQYLINEMIVTKNGR